MYFSAYTVYNYSTGIFLLHHSYIYPQTWQACEMATLTQTYVYFLDNLKYSVSNLGIAYRLSDLPSSPVAEATIWITQLKLQKQKKKKKFKFLEYKYSYTA